MAFPLRRRVGFSSLLASAPTAGWPTCAQSELVQAYQANTLFDAYRDD